MKKLYALFTLLIGISFSLAAQNPGCDGDRYVNEVFTDVVETIGVQFGQNVTFAGNQKDLLMDIYEPAGDNLEMRPVIVLAHGGSFVAGNRGLMKGMCEDFARRGFVAVTIDYRLIDIFVLDSIGFGEGVVMTVSDMKAAIRFLREDAATDNNYKINPDYVFAGGVSAGGVIAVHAAYMGADDDVPDFVSNLIDMHGGWEGNSSDNFEYSSSIQGVLNYSGSLTRANFIDADDPPLYSAHDEGDSTVPCGYGDSDAVFFPLYSYGSCVMHPRADEVGIMNEFYFKEGSNGHVSYLSGAENDIVIQQSGEFLAVAYCGFSTNVNDLEKENVSFQVFPNPNNGQFQMELAQAGEYTLNITNVLGRTIFQQDITEQMLTIDLSHLSLENGTYFVSLRNAQFLETKVLKIVK